MVTVLEKDNQEMQEQVDDLQASADHVSGLQTTCEQLSRDLQSEKKLTSTLRSASENQTEEGGSTQ